MSTRIVFGEAVTILVFSRGAEPLPSATHSTTQFLPRTEEKFLCLQLRLGTGLRPYRPMGRTERSCSTKYGVYTSLTRGQRMCMPTFLTRIAITSSVALAFLSIFAATGFCANTWTMPHATIDS